MPLFTTETARENALKSVQVRREKSERLKNPPPPPLAVPLVRDEEACHDRVMKQLDKVDEFLDQCKDADTFVRLTAAKERLWNLVYPKAGVMRPRPRRPILKLPEPLPMEMCELPRSLHEPPREQQPAVQVPPAQDSPKSAGGTAPMVVPITALPPAPKPSLVPSSRPPAPASPPPGMECLGPNWQSHIMR